MKKFISFFFLFSLASLSLYSQAPQKVLFENWTSSTCTPCAANNPELRTWMTAHDLNLCAVSYHVGWPAPGNDPMYLHNPAQSYDRRYYYTVNAVPTGVMQGTHTYIGAPFDYQDMSVNYVNYSQQSSPLGVIVTDTRVPPDSNRVAVTVTNYSNLPSGNYYLRVMVIERLIIYQTPPGSNGEIEFQNVFRKSIPTSLGTPISPNAGTYNFVFGYRINPVWRDTAIFTMVFVQNDVNHTVVNTFRSGMTMVGVPNTNQIPSDYSLSQNYPNPFNPTTQIKFYLPKDEFVTLKLYDILGAEVKTLVEGSHKAGIYEITADGSELSGGVYFYRLTAGTFTDTKKMILVK